MIQLDWFGRRTVAPEFWNLPASERFAVIAHEAGHRYHKHIARYILARLFTPWRPAWFVRHQMEYEADAFAASVGYGRELAAVLTRQAHPATATHPSTRNRVARLLQL